MSANEAKQVDISPPSEIENTRGRHKAAGPKSLSPFFLRDGDEELTTELAKFLESIWAREVIPNNRIESVRKKIMDRHVKVTEE